MIIRDFEVVCFKIEEVLLSFLKNVLDFFWMLLDVFIFVKIVLYICNLVDVVGMYELIWYIYKLDE